jgi:hypothetical protein
LFVLQRDPVITRRKLFAAGFEFERDLEGALGIGRGPARDAGEAQGHDN